MEENKTETLYCSHCGAIISEPLPIDWIKFGELYEQWKSGAITAVWFQKEMGLQANTFYRRLKEYERKFT